MQIDKKENHVLVTPDDNLVQTFFAAFNKNLNQFISDHILIDFSSIEKINSEEINLFLDIANQKRENHTSFILICKGVDIDAIPDEISVVPTLGEAEDTLEMDAIERDLMGY